MSTAVSFQLITGQSLKITSYLTAKKYVFKKDQPTLVEDPEDINLFSSKEWNSKLAVVDKQLTELETHMRKQTFIKQKAISVNYLKNPANEQIIENNYQKPEEIQEKIQEEIQEDSVIENLNEKGSKRTVRKRIKRG